MEIMTLRNEFTDCVLKNGRTDPDEWFNELDTYKSDWELWAPIFQTRT